MASEGHYKCCNRLQAQIPYCTTCQIIMHPGAASSFKCSHRVQAVQKSWNWLARAPSNGPADPAPCLVSRAREAAGRGCCTRRESGTRFWVFFQTAGALALQALAFVCTYQRLMHHVAVELSLDHGYDNCSDAIANNVCQSTAFGHPMVNAKQYRHAWEQLRTHRS